MSATVPLNGGESGEWLQPLDPDETRPVHAVPNISDRDIETVISRIAESTESGHAFLAASLLYT